MKLTIINLTEESYKRNDYCGLFAIEINGKKVFQVYDGEPEDNNLCRNFNDIYKLSKILNMVYEAGKQGDNLEMETKEVDEY